MTTTNELRADIVSLQDVLIRDTFERTEKSQNWALAIWCRFETEVRHNRIDDSLKVELTNIGKKFQDCGWEALAVLVWYTVTHWDTLVSEAQIEIWVSELDRRVVSTWRIGRSD